MTTGRINQVTIVNANKGPLWRLPLVAQRKRFFVTFVMALSPEGPEDRPVRRRQEQPPRRGRRSHSWLPLSPSRFPRALSAGHTCQASREVGRVPPRRPKRRPLPKVAAIQRSPRGRYLLLLSFRLGQRPVIHRAHPSAPSGRAADALGHTTSEAHYQRQASLIASLVRAMNPPRPRLLGLQGCSKDHATRTAQDMGQVH